MQELYSKRNLSNTMTNGYCIIYYIACFTYPWGAGEVVVSLPVGLVLGWQGGCEGEGGAHSCPVEGEGRRREVGEQ